MTSVLTMSVEDWSALGVVPRAGATFWFELTGPQFGTNLMSASKWPVPTDQNGTLIANLPDATGTSPGVIITSDEVEGFEKIVIAAYPATITGATELAQYIVDPRTTEPNPPTPTVAQSIATVANAAAIAQQTANAAVPAAALDAETSENVVGQTETAAALRGAYVAYLSPSGDATGATDAAAINAALLANQTVVLRGIPGGTPFWLDQAIICQSNNTLVIWDAHVKLINGLTSNIITNANAMLPNQNYGNAPDTHIRVYGIGAAWLDGSASTQVAPAAWNTWQIVGVCWINASDVHVDNVKIGPTLKWAGLQVGSTYVQWTKIELAQDRTELNQDGIDTGPGCSYIHIKNITGTTGDDGFSIFAKLGASGPTSPSVTPWALAAYAAAPLNLTVHHVYISNVDVDFGFNPIRLQAGDGAQLYEVHASNISKIGVLYSTGSHSAVYLGDTSTVATPPAMTDIYNISLSGFTGMADRLITAHTNFTSLKVDDAQIAGPFGALLYQANTGLSAQDITVSNVTATDTTASTGNRMMQTATGNTFTSVKFSAIKMGTTSALLANSASVTGLSVSNIEVTNATGPLVASSVQETGSIDNIFVLNSVPPRYSTPTKLRMGTQAPKFLGVDATPVPTFGSHIHCSNLKDPTGGTTYTAGYFIGDGTAWNRVITLGYTEPAPAFVKAGGNTSGSGVLAVQITVPTGGHAAGDLLAVAIASNAHTPTVTDSRGNTYSVATNAGSGIQASVATSLLATALQSGDTITITVTVAANIVADSAEFKNILRLDQTARNSGGATTSPNAGTTGPLAVPNELVLGVFALAAAAGTFTPGTGYTALNNLATPLGLAWEWQATTSTTAVTPSATVSSGHTYAAQTATFIAGG